MKETCPKCGKSDLTITYHEYTTYSLDQLDGDCVDLGTAVDTYNSELCRIYCEDCENDWDSLMEFNDDKNAGVENELS